MEEDFYIEIYINGCRKLVMLSSIKGGYTYSGQDMWRVSAEDISFQPVNRINSLKNGFLCGYGMTPEDAILDLIDSIKRILEARQQFQNNVSKETCFRTPVIST